MLLLVALCDGVACDAEDGCGDGEVANGEWDGGELKLSEALGGNVGDEWGDGFGVDAADEVGGEVCEDHRGEAEDDEGGGVADFVWRVVTDDGAADAPSGEYRRHEEHARESWFPDPCGAPGVGCPDHARDERFEGEDEAGIAEGNGGRWREQCAEKSAFCGRLFGG